MLYYNNGPPTTMEARDELCCSLWWIIGESKGKDGGMLEGVVEERRKEDGERMGKQSFG